ncbi:MAG TPA: hypothetical protein VFB22_06850 [Candidatus Baltobacteraceae bacterium]|nr:hypothetical protein [Candidatus Baltobacteraceae bacterium]
MAPVALAAVLLSGCGGGGAFAPPVPVGRQAAGQTVAVQFTIALPAPAGTSAVRRRVRYVSASTKSATVVVTPAGGTASAPVVIACTKSACSGTVQAPVGSDTFGVKLFDAANGTGNLLSTGTLTQTIVLDAANHVNVTFDGVVRALTVALSPSAVTAGSASSVDVAVGALDADGNTVVGPGSYVDANGNPLTIALADSDTSGATHLSTASLSAPPATPVKLSYDGAAIPCVTITASAASLTPAHALLPAAGPPTLYVAGFAAGSTTPAVVRAIANPATAPNVARTISGSATNLNPGIDGLATDACANLLATTASQTPAQQVLVFGATSNGNVAPSRSFGDPNNQDPGAVTVDAAGDVTTAYTGGFYNGFETAALETFSPTASGAVEPLRTIGTPGRPEFGVGYDPSGAIWAAEGSGDALDVIPSSATKLPVEPTLYGNVFDELASDGGTMPLATVDAAGNVYFASSVAANIFYTSSSTYTTMWILQFAAQSNGYPAPRRSIRAPYDSNLPPDQIVFSLGTDAAGNLYVLGPNASGGPSSVYEYAAPPSTSSTPSATFNPTPAPGLIAVAPDGTIYGSALDLNTGFDEVATFAPTNRSTPASTLNLHTSDSVWYLGVAADGTLYVGLVAFGSTQYRVAVYAPGASGNAAPLRTITLPSPASFSIQAALDPLGNLYAVYVVYDAQTGAATGTTVQVVPAGATAPSRSFTVPIAEGAGPAYDASRSALVLGNGGTFGTFARYEPYQQEPEELQEFPVTSTGMAAPIAQIRSGATDGIPYDPIAVGHDAAGRIYVENAGDGSVRVYDPLTRTIVRSILGLPLVGSMAVDADGTVYIAGSAGASDANLDARLRRGAAVRAGATATRRPRETTTADYGAILVYGPTASGIVSPTSVIPATTVGLAPVALAIAH